MMVDFRERFVSPLASGVLDAAARAPVRAARGRRPSSCLLRGLAAFFWFGVTIGFTAGASGQMAATVMGRTTPLLALVLGLAQAAPLIIAPRRPLLAWRIMVVGLLAGAVALASHQLFWPWPVTSWLAMVLVLFQVALAYPRRTTIGAGAITALVVLTAGTPFLFVLFLWFTIALVIAFGDAIGGRRAAQQRLVEQEELRRQDLARQAVLEERSRIARELHDVVAHHMSVVALQAEAAPYKIDGLPPTALRSFEVIRDSARQALSETRRLVGLLREEDEAAERSPQPSLERLDELLEAARQAGLTVESQIIGIPEPIDAGVDVSAYRIVQEALSNAARYAPGARTRVEVRYGPASLLVQVVDDGAAEGVPSEPGGGHGLVGMRERVAMVGGTLSTGPREGGGFTVTAELPY
jgi:signal transduction histidine kinase